MDRRPRCEPDPRSDSRCRGEARGVIVELRVECDRGSVECDACPVDRRLSRRKFGFLSAHSLINNPHVGQGFQRTDKRATTGFILTRADPNRASHGGVQTQESLSLSPRFALQSPSFLTLMELV